MVARPDISYDAVVVVPGIMGSTLRLADSGDVLWGFTDVVKYTTLWLSGGPAHELALTAQERAGELGRVVPDGLLRAPAAAPFLQGFEPYDGLVDRLRAVVAHRDAVLEFGYDWRLSVRHNARELARAAACHLRTWQDHPARTGVPVRRDAQLVIVAHSMGGLLARALPAVEGRDGVPAVTAKIRSVVTLGTPFLGAVKAAVLLNTGDGTPIRLAHKRRMRSVAVTCPGVYDLLPMYRCVRRGEDVVRLSAEDVEAIGGDPTLAHDAIGFDREVQGQPIAGHRLIYGTRQPTLQSMQIAGRQVVASPDDFERDEGGLVRDGGRLIPLMRDGDGTVGRDWATHGTGTVPFPLPQQHGALAKSTEAIEAVVAVVLDRTLGDVQGGAELGLDVPDVVAPNRPWKIIVTGESNPAVLEAELRDVGTGASLPPAPFVRAGGRLEATATFSAPGLYRVEVAYGGLSPVSQLVLCAADEGPDGG